MTSFDRFRNVFPPVFEEVYHTQDSNDIKTSYGKMYCI